MIYYVEDDAHIRDLSLYALRQAGLDAMGFTCADEFFAACDVALPEAALLDIMLPGVDGMEILRRLRADNRTKTLPVMMLTAKGSELDTVYGLDAGADDYLAKPFGMMELVSRVKALLRRAQTPASVPVPHASSLTCGPITLDAQAHRVFVGNTPVELTLKEFDLLHTLMEHEGLVLTRAQLLEQVWDVSFAGGTRTVDVHVRTLRQKLDEAAPNTSALIETVRGVGYRLRSSS